eukprot:7838308-Alexandrium_andersonii.AAC.1
MGCAGSGAVRRAGVHRPAVPLRRRGTQHAWARHCRHTARWAGRMAPDCADSWPDRLAGTTCGACPGARWASQGCHRSHGGGAEQ